MDALEYLKEGKGGVGERYDVIIQDAIFEAPHTLLTEEGFQLMHSLLLPGGLMIQNLFARSAPDPAHAHAHAPDQSASTPAHAHDHSHGLNKVKITMFSVFDYVYVSESECNVIMGGVKAVDRVTKHALPDYYMHPISNQTMVNSAVEQYETGNMSLQLIDDATRIESGISTA